jgi:hypothetical protein
MIGKIIILSNFHLFEEMILKILKNHFIKYKIRNIFKLLNKYFQISKFLNQDYDNNIEISNFIRKIDYRVNHDFGGKIKIWGIKNNSK